MAKRSSRILELTKRGAEAQLRELVQEMKYLLDLFPHLKDSFDRDELPTAFIIKRDSQRSKKPKNKAGKKRPRKAATKA